MLPVVLSVIGRNDSDKTRVFETLISLLKSKGLRIGVIKYLEREDREGTPSAQDTSRYRNQGAETVMLAGKRQLAFSSNLFNEIPVEKLIFMFQDYDLVLLDGYDDVPFPKIEVYHQDARIPPRQPMDNVLATCSERPTAGQVPHFGFEQLQSLAALIEKKFFKQESGRKVGEGTDAT